MEVKEKRLTLFCLSCRALGREVEQEMLAYLLAEHLIEEVDFLPTGKNAELHDFLAANL